MELQTDVHPSFWEIATKRSITPRTAHKMMIQGSAYSPDGRICATGSADGLTKLWEVSTGVEITTLAAHKEGVAAVAFSPEGKTLATVDDSGTIKLWNLRTYRDVASINLEQKVDFLGFTPDGRTLACHGVDGTLRLLPAPSLSEIDVLEKQNNSTHTPMKALAQ